MLLRAVSFLVSFGTWLDAGKDLLDYAVYVILEFILQVVIGELDGITVLRLLFFE